MRIKELTASRVTWGYRRVHVLLAREGWAVNAKKVYRIYREEGLSMRAKRPRRHKAAQVRRMRHVAGTRWGTRRYLDMNKLREMEAAETAAERVAAA